MEPTEKIIDQDLDSIQKNLEEKGLKIEGRPEQSEVEKESLKSAVGERIQTHVPSFSPLGPHTDDQRQVTEPTPEVKEKVQGLINTVFTKGLDEGIREAEKMNDPAVLDYFHDVLVDQFYSALIERKKLDQVN